MLAREIFLKTHAHEKPGDFAAETRIYEQARKKYKFPKFNYSYIIGKRTISSFP